MSFMDQVMQALGKAVNVVMYAAGTITGIALAGAVEFTQVACEKFMEYRAKNRSTNLALANKPVHLLTRNINDEIAELERKKGRDSSFNNYDNQKLTSLYQQRDKLKDDVRNNNELRMVEKLQNGQGIFDNVHITNVNTHVLQFHVGQTVFDQFFFGCPRWDHSTGGCKQIVKLKSPAQLASALEAFYGRGIM